MKSKKVTVIINNRDLLEWPRAMCAYIEKMKGLHEIIIVDNGSSNRALLSWYKEIPHKVIFLDNLGHQAPWISGVIDSIETDYYVVTDPDLDISSTPIDCLLHLRGILEKHPDLGKVGLLLETSDIPLESPYWQHVSSYENSLQSTEIIDNKFRIAPVDTTFAIYNRKNLREYKITGARACSPYVARHLPWYITTPEGEFKYYLDNATPTSCSYKKFTGYSKPNRLYELYLNHQDKVSTKWTSYFQIYNNLLNSIADHPLHMLEIGVQNGGSLEIWGKYFKNALAIIGCDINPACGNLVYSDPRISVVVGNSTSLPTYQEILQKSGGHFDLIIDDGSHNSLDVISNFINYFPLLSPGGIYIIEDMHCAYWPEYGGGYFNQRSASAFIKCLFDLVNIEHCRSDFSPQQLFQTFFAQGELPKCLEDNSIYSISAYNSVYVIQKSSVNSNPLLGEVVLGGSEAMVDNRVMQAKSSLA